MGLEPVQDFKDQRRVYVFGAFELDLRARELRKHGLRIKLQDQPLEILILLLENAGDIVSREQIRARLWPDGINVDYANAINSAMRKLRDALSDTAENSRFIETLPRSGYRFIAPVSNRMVVAETPKPRLVVSPDPTPSEIAKPSARVRRQWLLVTVFATLAAGFGVAGWFVLGGRHSVNTQLSIWIAHGP